MKHVQQEHGYAMLIAIFTTVLISVIGLGLLTMNVHSLITSKNEEVDQSVYYVAEAGLNVKMAELISIADNAYLETIIDRQKKYAIEKTNYDNCEQVNPGSCPFNFSYNFDKNYKEFFRKKYNDNITILKSQFNGFLDSAKKATFIIPEIPLEIPDPFYVEVKSTGYIQNKTRTVVKKIEIKSDVEEDNINIAANPIDTEEENPLTPIIPNYPKNENILKPPTDKKITDVAVFVANRSESDFNCNSMPETSECWLNGNGKKGFVIGSVDKGAADNFLPTLEKYTNMIKTLKELDLETYSNSRTSGTYSIGKLKTQTIDVKDGETLTLLIDSTNFSAIEKLTVSGSGILNLVITGENTLIKGTIKPNGEKDKPTINLILEGTPDFSGKTFDYNATNIIALNSGDINLQAQSGSLNGGNLISNTNKIHVNSSNDKPSAGICTPNAAFSSNGTGTFTSIVVNKYSGVKGSSLSFNPSGNPCDLDSSIFDLIDKPNPDLPPTKVPGEAPKLPEIIEEGEKYILKDTLEI